MELKKRLGMEYINKKVILSLLIGLTMVTFILCITLAEVSKGFRKADMTETKQVNKDYQEDTINLAKDYSSEILALVKNVNMDELTITLYDTDTEQDIPLSYYGGSDIRNKFNEVISISQVPVGAIVEAGYRKEDSKLIKLHITDKAWEYVGVNNFSIDSAEGIMKLAEKKYRYARNVYVIDGDTFTDINSLTEQDELTVRGIEEVIWSITVTRGHGTVRLKDHEAFLGGYITVGYEAMQLITEETVIAVREGSYNLTVENGSYSVTKNVTIQRNRETEISLKDLGPEAVKYGKVTFTIEPFGADLYIDSELTSYANAIELPYGDHSIEVSLGGYTTYQGNLYVDKEEVSIAVDLPEAPPREDTIDSISGTDTPSTGSGEDDPDEVSESESSDGSSKSEDEQNEQGMVDEEHLIYIQKPEKVSVYLNGIFKGISPVSFPKLIGKHVITFIRDGYETMSYTIEVSDDGLDSYFSLPELIKK